MNSLADIERVSLRPCFESDLFSFILFNPKFLLLLRIPKQFVTTRRKSDQRMEEDLDDRNDSVSLIILS